MLKAYSFHTSVPIYLVDQDAKTMHLASFNIRIHKNHKNVSEINKYMIQRSIQATLYPKVLTKR